MPLQAPQRKSIAKAFAKLRATHPRIVDVPTPELDAIIDTFKKWRTQTRPAYLVVILALLSLAIAPISVHFYLGFADDLSIRLLSAIPNRQFFTDNAYINISLGAVCLATPIYLFAFPGPSFNIISQRAKWLARRRESSLPVFDRSTSRFWFFAMSILVPVAFIPIAYAIAFGFIGADYARTALYVYLLVPLPLVVIAPIFALLLIAVALSVRLGQKTKNNEELDQLPSVIICKLIIMLDSQLDTEFKSPSSSSRRRAIGRSVEALSQLVKRLGEIAGESHSADRYARYRLEEASQAILSLKIEAMLPNSESGALLTRKAISLLNIFLSGNLRDLPTSPYTQLKEISVSRKLGILRNLISLGWLAIFLAAPLIAWTLISKNFAFTLDESVRPMIPILYTIWCVAGIVSASDRLAPEARAIIVETVKLLVSRK